MMQVAGVFWVLMAGGVFYCVTLGLQRDFFATTTVVLVIYSVGLLARQLSRKDGESK